MYSLKATYIYIKYDFTPRNWSLPFTFQIFDSIMLYSHMSGEVLIMRKCLITTWIAFENFSIARTFMVIQFSFIFKICLARLTFSFFGTVSFLNMILDIRFRNKCLFTPFTLMDFLINQIILLSTVQNFILSDKVVLIRWSS